MRGPKHAVAISGAASAALGLVVLVPLPAQAATTLNVAQGAGCSDTPTDPTGPYCTISAAVRAAAAGDTISVGAGTYREQVVVNKANLTVVTTSSATVTGADSGSTPVRSYGFQVQATASGAQVGGFTVQDVKFAGVRVDAGSGVVIDDVDVSGSAAHGIELIGGSGNTVLNVHSHDNTSIGVRLLNEQNSKVLSSETDHNHNHGVSLQGGSANRVDMVTSFANVNLPGAARTATGIDVNKNAAGQGSTAAVIEQNTTYGNGDSGIEIYQGSTGATVHRNISYSNGDHGIDISFAPNGTVTSNTVVGNPTPGINVEGGSTGTRIRDNISVDNAVHSTGTHGDIRVDATSISSTTLDRDLVFNSSGSGTLIEWAGTDYSSLATFRSATGQEARGLSADPKFASSTYDLSSDSPAVDAADAGVPGWMAEDRMGNTPIDTSKDNTGTGTPPYADLGALELTTGSQPPPPADNPPIAKLTASPSTVAAGGTVTLDASGSSDDKGISSYAFDCGNGSPVKTGAAKSATCSYASAGSFTAKVTVTDTTSQTASATAPVTVTAVTPPPPPGGGGGGGGAADAAPTAKLSVPSAAAVGQTVTLDASGSSDDKGISSYAFDCGNGTAVKTGTAKTATCSYASAGSFTAKVTVTDTAGQTASASAQVKVSGTAAGPHAMLTVNDATVRQLVPVRLDASGSAAGSAAIDSYTFNCGKGGADRSSSKATMTCRYRARGSYTATVMVTDASGHTSRATVVITVRRGGNPTARLALSDRHVARGERMVADASHSSGDRWWPVTKVRISCAGHSRTAHTTDLAMGCSFRHRGVHRIRLTVWNNLGHADTVVRRIWVHRG